MELKACVITISDRASQGVYEDRSGPVAVQILREAGFDAGAPVVIPDSKEAIQCAICEAVAGGARLVLTTGGTGVGPRDFTPEATAPLIKRELSHLMSAIVSKGLQNTPHALIARGVAGLTKEGALVVNAPGSTGGVRDAAEVVVTVASHILAQVDGGDH